MGSFLRESLFYHLTVDFGGIFDRFTVFFTAPHSTWWFSGGSDDWFRLRNWAAGCSVKNLLLF